MTLTRKYLLPNAGLICFCVVYKCVQLLFPALNNLFMFLIGILSVIQGMVGLALFWGEPDRKWQILISIAFLGLGSVFIFATL